MRQIKRIFVHCTAGPQTQTIEEIKNYWKKTRGWKDPGYHYIIKANGEIVPLQPEEKPSNGVAGYNSTSINVCYIGGVDRQGRPVDNRTDAQKTSLATLLKDLHSRYPDAEILGHRDVWGSDPKNWKKMCPCFDVKRWWNEVLAEDNMETVVEKEPEKQVEPIKIEPLISEQPKKGLISTILSIINKFFKL
jgi:N-acetyl-anhydromuramyl-L-alanine amidase AmpD